MKQIEGVEALEAPVPNVIQECNKLINQKLTAYTNTIENKLKYINKRLEELEAKERIVLKGEDDLKWFRLQV